MTKRRGITVAIDGVVGAGKSSTARQVAVCLGYTHLDTGAMYRAVTLAALRAGTTPEAVDRLGELLAGLELQLETDAAGPGRVLLHQEDVTDAIRRPEVTSCVGAYADLPLVRRALIAQQQRLGAHGGVVAEGRDTASVVFPAAELKVRMVAALDERARRRHRELAAKGVSTTLEQVAADIAQRDAQDEARDYGAAPAADVVVLDTTALTFAEQVQQIVTLARSRGA